MAVTNANFNSFSNVVVNQDKFVTLGAGQANSDVIDVRAMNLVGIWIPGVWTAANLNIQATRDNVNFHTVQIEGADIELQAPTASTLIVVNPTHTIAYNSIRIVCSPTQAAERTVYLSLRAY